MDNSGTDKLHTIQQYIDSSHRVFRSDDVVNVRAGYRWKDGQLTDEPVITVAVRKKRRLDNLEGRDVIPNEIGNFPIDVVTATLHDHIASDPVLNQALLEGAPPNPSIKYKPPTNIHLSPAGGPMKIACLVSPDSAWSGLKDFINKKDTKSFVIAMYDFTAPHVYGAFREVATNNPDVIIRMVLSPGEALPSAKEVETNPNDPKAHDLHEQTVVDGLSGVLKSRFKFSWASIRGDNRIFAHDYHEKVLVRDNNAFWLSSGNWQSSNQPVVDFVTNVPSRTVFGAYDRDWHVIVEHKDLASIFQGFIDYDLQEASQAGAVWSALVDVELPEVFVSDNAVLEIRKAPAKVDPIAPLRFEFKEPKSINVQPLLTPDNYAQVVLALVQQAKICICFQNQSLNVKQNQQICPEFDQLLHALAEKSRKIPTRIIFRDFLGSAANYLPTLINKYGFNKSSIKIQSNCHAKGIIIDDEILVIGSHNWTNYGVRFNRDASLVIRNKEVAQYFQRVFNFDWDNWADVPRAKDFMFQLVRPGDVPQPNMIHIPWSQLLDDAGFV